MGSKLSHKLLDLGFFSALGTSEYPGMKAPAFYVQRGKSNTYDMNNGVMVVYDETGAPWIIQTEKAMRDSDWDGEIIQAYNLQRGAYVPHSNDGGLFIREVVPNL